MLFLTGGGAFLSPLKPITRNKLVIVRFLEALDGPGYQHLHELEDARRNSREHSLSIKLVNSIGRVSIKSAFVVLRSRCHKGIVTEYDTVCECATRDNKNITKTESPDLSLLI